MLLRPTDAAICSVVDTRITFSTIGRALEWCGICRPNPAANCWLKVIYNGCEGCLRITFCGTVASCFKDGQVGRVAALAALHAAAVMLLLLYFSLDSSGSDNCMEFWRGRTAACPAGLPSLPIQVIGLLHVTATGEWSCPML